MSDARIANKRTVIDTVTPMIDNGRFAIKRVVGDIVRVEADIFTDGHDVLACQLLYRREEDKLWQSTVMSALGNDRWYAEFVVSDMGRYRYTVCGWADPFLTWRAELVKRKAADQDLRLALLTGAKLLEERAKKEKNGDRKLLIDAATKLRATDDAEDAFSTARSEELTQFFVGHPPAESVSTFTPELVCEVDRNRARFSTWYEMFPRSAGDGGSHGTLRDTISRLPYVAGMGFDILYLPPIHPIGETKRKGKNNALVAQSSDVGSPWAIGSDEGGHKSIHPRLGELADFHALVRAAGDHNMEIALDIAFQCSPDHPYVKEHRRWFRSRPDGSVQFAENPPKKYEDIYPFDFETDDWQALWQELKSVFDFWIAQGVRVFRVDNPHTKPFPFWEWLIAEVKRDHPDVLFLSEAFTRPKVMRRLAKLGFSQSYTYFTWRNTKRELTEYFTELTQTEMREYFRPNAWPNTPDILNEYLQHGGRPAFMIRLVLAATLCANYGIYGPAFELAENAAREPGSEEYLNSEKYEIRRWNWEAADSLRDFIARVNRTRHDNLALQDNSGLTFHAIDNEQMIAYSKVNADLTNVIVVVVNLDPQHVHSGWLTLPLESLGLAGDASYQMHDLLSDARYLWQGPRNFVQLDPHSAPAHIFRLRRRIANERDFDYFEAPL